MTDPRPVCIIGAGPSGLPVVKALAEAGIPFDAFEAEDRVGGLWAFGTPGGPRTGAYRRLAINSSRDRSAYRDFPMPRDWPAYPTLEQMAAYFQVYADAFGLGARITFRTAVTAARRDGDGWQVTLSNGQSRRYRALVVANGHHREPRWPDPMPPGRFDGRLLHAHDYADPDDPAPLRGRPVVVVGLGNSAADIASDLAQAGGRVFLSIRRGAWILPKTILGVPVDSLRVNGARTPWRLQSLAARLLLGLTVPGHARLGLPRPDHPPLAAHPTMSDALPAALRRGDVLARPPIAAFDGTRIRFADGSAAGAEAVIFCTGYRVSFPFLDPAFLTVEGNDLPLWMRLVRPGETDLFFVGLLQPLGAIMPLAEAQARLVADALAGRFRFPDAATMAEATAREREAVARRYVASPRHTMQVDFDRYLRDLEVAHRAGLARAAA